MNNTQPNGSTSQQPLLQLEDEVDLIGDFVKQQTQQAATATNNNQQLSPLLNGFEVNGVNQLTTQVEVSLVQKKTRINL